MQGFLFKFMVLCHRLVRGLANRILDKNRIRPRDFSNVMIRKYAPYFSGSIVNVSGWKDSDAHGGHYKDYFTNASSYALTNVGGQKKGFGATEGEYTEYELDLLKEVPENLKRKFDVAFNHTTLEHIYDFKKAFANICELSKDAVIIVVPVMQQIHHTEDFGDYWRPTTMTIAKMFLDNGLEPLVIECNEQPFAPIYCFAIASRNPDKYRGVFPKRLNFQMGAMNYGSSIKSEFIPKLLKGK